jgi:hypothetical protein
MSCTQFYSIKLFILRHAWLNLWDKHMTTGRINQVTSWATEHTRWFAQIQLRWTSFPERVRRPMAPQCQGVFTKNSWFTCRWHCEATLKLSGNFPKWLITWRRSDQMAERSSERITGFADCECQLAAEPIELKATSISRLCIELFQYVYLSSKHTDWFSQLYVYVGQDIRQKRITRLVRDLNEVLIRRLSPGSAITYLRSGSLVLLKPKLVSHLRENVLAGARNPPHI